MEVKFRIATAADLEDIIKLTNECFDEQTPLSYARKIWRRTEHDPIKFTSTGISMTS